MFEDLKKELLSFIKDINENIKNEEDLLYITKRLDTLVDSFLKQTEKIMEYKQNELSSILEIQELQNNRLEELQNKVNNICLDIYDDEDVNNEFEIACPYCGANFVALVDENIKEIICPECSNHIELDWSGNPDDEKNGCSGGCSHCGGCE